MSKAIKGKYEYRNKYEKSKKENIRKKLEETNKKHPKSFFDMEKVKLNSGRIINNIDDDITDYIYYNDPVDNAIEYFNNGLCDSHITCDRNDQNLSTRKLDDMLKRGIIDRSIWWDSCDIITKVESLICLRKDEDNEGLFDGYMLNIACILANIRNDMKKLKNVDQKSSEFEKLLTNIDKNCQILTLLSAVQDDTEDEPSKLELTKDIICE